MQWVDETEPKERSATMENGMAMRLSVDDDGERWQHFQMSFGTFEKDKTFSECLDSWPREAIAEARRRLDEFEAKLNST